MLRIPVIVIVVSTTVSSVLHLWWNRRPIPSDVLSRLVRQLLRLASLPSTGSATAACDSDKEKTSYYRG